MEPKRDTRVVEIPNKTPNLIPKSGPNAEEAKPVAAPSPPMDGKKPIAIGPSEVEKFLVTTDTAGGD